jgi:hypothetical protein
MTANEYSYISNPTAIMSNDLNFSSDVLGSINHYAYILDKTAAVLSGPAGKESGDSAKIIYDSIVSPSLFNVYQSVLPTGIAHNIPLLDTMPNNQNIEATKSSDGNKTTGKIYFGEIDDCSIANLVKLSGEKNSKLGNARYRYTDFMYCKELGKISNNHLITLRRFASPIWDNIFTIAADTEDETNNMSTPSDIGRMVTWFGTEDNKLENILKYDFKATFEELEAKIQEKASQENESERGLMGDFVNMFNPKYNKSTEAGVSPNALGRILSMDGSQNMFTTEPYANNEAVNGSMYDHNAVYEPKDTMRKTYKYTGKLDFNQEFDLVFKYQLRSYNNINAKSAFLDLLANILTVTYKTGTFWGGEQRIIGSPQNVQGWKKAMEFSNGLLGAGETFISQLMQGQGGDAFSSLSNAIGGLIGDTLGIDMGEIIGNPKETLTKLVSPSEKGGFDVGAALKGSAQNLLGRPAVYAFDSLLTNDAVGLWHVTIGNPLNPIAVMGNMIIDNTTIEHSGPLGLDDFPSELKVTVHLKHAMSRDSVDIQKMYTQGVHAIYNKILNKDNYKNNANKVTNNTKSKTNNVQDSFEQININNAQKIANNNTTPVVSDTNKYNTKDTPNSTVGNTQQAGFNIGSGPKS